MTKLTKQFELNDVGLRKICIKHQLRQCAPSCQSESPRGDSVLGRYVLDALKITAWWQRGFALGVAAHGIRILSETSRWGWPHAKIGLCSIGGPSTLARMIPVNLALEFMFTGDFMPAARALQLGLANHVVPDADLERVTDEIVAKLLANAPLSIAATKKSVFTTQHLPYGEAVAKAHEILDELMISSDAMEGMRAFVEKRRPVWERK